MRPALVALSLLLSTQAIAGGFGIIGGGGTRTHTGHWYLNADMSQQYEESEWISMMGGGLEVTLGDRDERFLGYFRGYYWQDEAETDPLLLSTSVTADGASPWQGKSQLELADWRNWRDETRKLGMLTVGMSVGLVGSPREVMLTLNADVGSGFMSNDKSEFLQAQIGPGVTWAASRSIHVFANTLYSARYRKGFSHGANGFAGVRYMFD